MAKNGIETVMGAVVLLIAGGFLSMAYQSRNTGNESGAYALNAQFTDVSGINTGSDVRVGGVKVGTVSTISLDPQTYKAQLVLSVRDGVSLPTDSSAAIVGDGLLGSKFVSLQPGADEEMLEAGEEIEFTQSSISLEQLIGKFVFSGGGVDKGGDAPKEDTEKEDAENASDSKEEKQSPFGTGIE